MKKPSNAALGWNLLRAATEFGVARETLRRGLRQNGVAVKPEYSTREIFEALAGALEYERTRVERARADKMEMDLRRKRNETITLEEVDRLLSELVILPLRERLLSMAASIDVLCNPQSPQLARSAIKGHVEETMRLLRDKLPKEVTNKA